MTWGAVRSRRGRSMSGRLEPAGSWRMRSCRMRSAAVVVALLAGLGAGACSRPPAGTEPGGASGTQGPQPQAGAGGMFLANRSMLRPGDAMKAAVSVSIASFISPQVQPVGPGQPAPPPNETMTFELLLTHQGSLGDLVILDVYPYQYGPDGDPAVRYVKDRWYGTLLKSGESKSITVEVVRERVSRTSQAGPEPAGGALPVGASPAGQAGGLPDAATGLQVLLVGQFAGEVPPDAWEQVREVPPGEFAATYGMYMGYQAAIGVPAELIM